MSSSLPQDPRSARVPDEILVVDDDVDIRESLVELLQAEGYIAVGAANGEEALGLLRSRRASVVLLDLMMPVMDGFQFRREQLGDPALSQIPVVVVSAGGGCEQAALEMGVLGCVKKPLHVPQLLRMIRSACAAAAAS
jgi:two-component system, chemotaxis family, chemotaxis protein CheY